jgi:hypothetical protein
LYVILERGKQVPIGGRSEFERKGRETEGKRGRPKKREEEEGNLHKGSILSWEELCGASVGEYCRIAGRQRVDADAREGSIYPVKGVDLISTCVDLNPTLRLW